MICNKCNSQVQEGVQFCPVCGNDLRFVCNTSDQQFSQSTVSSNSINIEQDKVNVLFVILSWFIPLAGLIIFIVKRKDSPKTAKASGLCALISFVLSFLVLFFVITTAVGTVNGIIDKAKEDSYEIIEDNNSDVVEESDTVVDNSSVTEPTVNVDKDWKQYQFAVNGKTLSLPISYNDLATATGLKLKDNYLNGTLKNGYYVSINMYKGDKYALNIEILNDTGAEAKYTDCKVTRISQTKYNVTQSGVVVSFPGGLKAGDSITETQITSLFGTPSEIKDYSSDNYSSKKYHYFSDTKWTTTNNYKLSVVNGVLDDIQLDHRS